MHRNLYILGYEKLRWIDLNKFLLVNHLPRQGSQAYLFAMSVLEY